MKKILIVEDDVSIHSLLKDLLERESYLVRDAYSGTEALLLLEKEIPHLIILDLMLPGLSGEELIKKISNIPIIVLSAKSTVKDKVDNLLNGAVDYLVKPFDNEELLARIKVHLRNSQKEEVNYHFKELKLLDDQHTLLINDNKVYLTKTEFAILKQLLQNIKRGISKTRLLELISEDTKDGDENSLKVHISNLKRKIGKYTKRKYIETIWGIGYKILEEDSE